MGPPGFSVDIPMTNQSQTTTRGRVITSYSIHYTKLYEYSDKFQRYIRSVNDPDAHVNKNGGDHSTAGALHALEKFGMLGRIFAYVIAGHHAGLPDWNEGVV